MKQITVVVKDLRLTATLIREANPRLAICQDKVVLLNKYDRVIAERDLLNMFNAVENFRVKKSVNDPSIVTLVAKNHELVQVTPTDTHGRYKVELNGDMAQQFNETHPGDEDDYWDNLIDEWDRF